MNEAAGGVRSIATSEAASGASGPVLPSSSVTLLAARVSRTVPSPQPLTVTVYASSDPDGASTAQPAAVPPRVKSVASSPVTGLLNDRT